MAILAKLFAACRLQLPKLKQFTKILIKIKGL
jgi:hypothetical protein